MELSLDSQTLNLESLLGSYTGASPIAGTAVAPGAVAKVERS